MAKERIKLTISTDWGIANLVGMAGWIIFGLRRHYDVHSDLVIRTSTGCLDNIIAVGEGRADLGIATPYFLTGHARAGRKPFVDKAYPISEFGGISHNDRLMCVVRPELGVSTLEEIAEKQLPVRIVVDEGEQTDDMMKISTRAILDYYGITDDAVRSWGGEILDADFGPVEAVLALMQNRADLVINESVPMPMWDSLMRQGAQLISFSDDLLDMLERDYGFVRRELPHDRFGEKGRGVQTLDWSDYVVFGRDDIDDELAYRVAQVMAETYSFYEARYFANQPDDPAHRAFDPITVPDLFRSRSAPLHPGVAAYYEDWKKNPNPTGPVPSWPTNRD